MWEVCVLSKPCLRAPNFSSLTRQPKDCSPSTAEGRLLGAWTPRMHEPVQPLCWRVTSYCKDQTPGPRRRLPLGTLGACKVVRPTPAETRCTAPVSGPWALYKPCVCGVMPIARCTVALLVHVSPLTLPVSQRLLREEKRKKRRNLIPFVRTQREHGKMPHSQALPGSH